MPKAPSLRRSARIARNSTHNYPQGTWAMLKPDTMHLPCIFLTEPFNCLGKFPDNIPAHHQLPMDPKISDRHCQIRIENVTEDGKTKPRIILEDISDVGTTVNKVLIKRDPSIIVIKNRSRIAFPASNIPSGYYNYTFYITNPPINEEFSKEYKLIKTLGKGAFSTVYLAECLHDHQNVAVKVLTKCKIPNKIKLQDKVIKSELQILNNLGHENLIKILDYYDEPDKVYLVIEYVKDGSFLELLNQHTCMTEKEIRIIFIQLFNAIKYLHDRRIVHRDLKPDNILMSNKEDLKIKVTDFGLSKMLDADNLNMQTRCGTFLYEAPEIVNNQPYTKAVDMWSAGVILYFCLNGSFPFNGKKKSDIMMKIKAGKYSMDSPRWSQISNPAKNLVDALLTVNPQMRLTAEGALSHQFFKCE